VDRGGVVDGAEDAAGVEVIVQCVALGVVMTKRW